MKKIWDKIRPYLAIIALVFAVFAPMLAPWLATLALPSYLAWAPTLAAGLAELGWPLSAALGLGVAAVVDSDATKDVIDKVGGAIGDVGSAVGGAVGDTLSGFLSQPSVLIVGGLILAYFLLSRDKDQSGTELRTDAKAEPGQATRVAAPADEVANGPLANEPKLVLAKET